MNKITVSFEMEKDTKNTIRFKEITEGVLGIPKIGTVYIPKVTLAGIGYEPGKTLVVTLSVK